MKKIQTQYLELNDISIAYAEHGNGKNLILLHGNSENKEIFKKYQIEYFDGYHTYALDSRGHGKSISTDTEYSIEMYSDDVIAFCEKKDIKEAYCIGYSDGGNIALFLAMKRPDIFTKIVAISPNYLVSGTTDGTLRLINKINGVFIFLQRIGFNTRKMVMRFRLMLTDIGITEEEIRSIKTRMRFLYAEKDMIKEEHIKSMTAMIEGSTIKRIEKSTHISIIGKKETIEDMKMYFKN